MSADAFRATARLAEALLKQRSDLGKVYYGWMISVFVSQGQHVARKACQINVRSCRCTLLLAVELAKSAIVADVGMRLNFPILDQSR